MTPKTPSKKKSSSSRGRPEKIAVIAAALEAPPAAAIEKKPLPLSFAHLLPLVLTGCFLYLWWNHAWLGDDMNFTVRSALNLLDGKGISWNANERLESFTHPTWFFLLTIGQFLTHDIYDSTLLLSFVFSFAAYLALLRESKNALALALVGVLLFSQAFIDYTSSGLENSLSYLLLYLIFERHFSRRVGAVFYLLIAITLLNRMDYALILLPAMIMSWKTGGYKIKPVLLGMLPLILWLLFSLFYFGAPFPNTLLAKMNTGYPQVEYYARFLNFIGYSVRHDPITLIIIGLGVLLPLLVRGEGGVISIGIVLYGFYVRAIGGDFMGGRFLSIPVYLAVYALMRMAIKREEKWCDSSWLSISSFAALLLSGLLLPTPFKNDTHYKNDVFEQGVADERGFYFQKTSLALGKSNWVKVHESDEEFISVCGMGGVVALLNMDSYIYDSCGLGSPYTARLPAIEVKSWRIGHHMRHMVPGFRCWLKDPTLRFDDSELTRLFKDIRLVTTGPLFDSARTAAILRLNFDTYAFDRQAFRSPVSPIWRSGENCPGDYDYDALFHKTAS